MRGQQHRIVSILGEYPDISIGLTHSGYHIVLKVLTKKGMEVADTILTPSEALKLISELVDALGRVTSP